MELGKVLLVIIKIVVSTSFVAQGAILMGGHIENKNHTDISDVVYSDDYEYADSVEDAGKQIKNKSEEVPNPSPLVLPGYNLPETIFNHGKPFYVEKDPLTGKIDFDHKSPSLKSEEYEYIDDLPSDDIYDKKNINRKDGSLSSHSSHKQADINQLTPNFHDFLNLPVKYNPEKYVYPLISSSYASTKIQGSVNKFHNHKDSFGVQKTTTTKKPQTQSYYTTTYGPRTTQRTMATTRVTTTTTTKPTTVKRYPELTTAPANIMNAGMSHPSFGEEYDYYDETTVKPTTKTVTTQDVHLTSKSTSTKAPMSLFEQLFGDYDDTVTTTKSTKPVVHLTTTTPITTTSLKSTTTPTTTHNIVMGMNNNYEYTDEDYSDDTLHDNIAVENKLQAVKTEEHLSVEPLKTVTKLTPVNKTVFETKPKLDKKPSYETSKYKPFTYKPTDKPKYSSTLVTSTQRSVTSTTNQPTRVTSLPLGDNHIGAPINRDPIIVATQNLREKLNSEKVPEAPQEQRPFNQLAPSSSNIHIAPGQDTVSFVVGHHQSVGDGGQYVGSAVEDNAYQTRPSRPSFDNREPSVNFKPPKPEVTIQPLQNSEAALAIGLPVGVKQVPGQVMDASLPEGHITFPKNDGKVVFPDDQTPKPVRNEQNPASKDVLQLNSKPMYHQLPSDLTPPKESEVATYDRPARPPWDPRPGHFHSGKPEYVRPPRPRPDVAYKRIDYLPNILPQFRPNTKPHYSMGPPPYPYDQRLNRQPLLERPSNRPIGFFEKMGPPPPPPGIYKRYPPKNVVRIEERRPTQYHLDDRRPLAQQPPQSLEDNQSPMAEDRIMNDPPRRPEVNNAPELNLYQTPPNIQIANRRESESGVETLQMIQAKNEKKDEDVSDGITSGDTVKVAAKDDDKPEADKTIYKVYPVNTPDEVVESKPKKPEGDFNYYEYQDRNDDPILKPHPRPVTVPVKSDFPYPLERPESPDLNADVQHDIISNNQWNAVGDNAESRIVTGSKGYGNQISATLKTFTDKPIAIAYTPTESNMDKYSMPNYGSLVIPEIRPGTVENADTGYGSKNEFTVHASINTNPKPPSNHKYSNHKEDLDMDSPVPQQDFQAPFQASVKLDAATNHGWSVLREKSKSSTSEDLEVTTLPLATTSEFDIENFKPQLEGGFKPLYSLPDEEGRKAEDIPEREE